MDFEFEGWSVSILLTATTHQYPELPKGNGIALQGFLQLADVSDSPSCLQGSPFLRLKLFPQSVFRGLFLTELQWSLSWSWAQSSVSDCPPSCGGGPANWTLMDQNSLTEMTVENYLVLILGVTQGRIGSHLPPSVKGCVWLSHPPCLILFSSPKANQSTFVYMNHTWHLVFIT